MLKLPFRNIYFSTHKTRKEIEELIVSQTFLSDANYKKPDENTRNFYGSVNSEVFTLQNINNPKIVPFAEGIIFGVGHEMYIQLKLKGLRSLRIYLLLIILTLSSFGILLFQLSLVGVSVFNNIPALFAFIITLLLLFQIIKLGKLYAALEPSSINYFRGLLEAELIVKKDIPAVFKS